MSVAAASSMSVNNSAGSGRQDAAVHYGSGDPVFNRKELVTVAELPLLVTGYQSLVLS